MKQQEIDQLLKDSSIIQSNVNLASFIPPSFQQESYSQGFQSFQQSKNFVHSRGHKLPLQPISEIKVISIPKTNLPPKQFKPLKNFPYNYINLQQRQKQLLFTKLYEQNIRLKQQMSERDKQLQVAKQSYRILRQQKAKCSPSLVQLQLQKQLSACNERCAQLQQKVRSDYRPSSKKQKFVSVEQLERREGELLLVIEKLKDRLILSDREMKVLQAKLNQDNVEEYAVKLQRVEQLEYRMENMVQQAHNDRALIEVLKDKNREFQDKIRELGKGKNNLELQIKRMELGQNTMEDTLDQLKEVKKQKDMLEKSLKELSGNIMQRMPVKNSNRRPEDIVQDLYHVDQ